MSPYYYLVTMNRYNTKGMQYIPQPEESTWIDVWNKLLRPQHLRISPKGIVCHWNDGESGAKIQIEQGENHDQFYFATWWLA